MLRLVALGSLATVALVGCKNTNSVQCDVNSNCNLTGGGVCSMAPTGNQWCAYGDPSCPSGLRYATGDVGDGLAGSCVALSEVDAGTPDTPPGDSSCRPRVAFVDGKPSFGPLDDGTGQREVWVANPDGSGMVNLSNSASIDDAHPSWSPDGRKVAFASNRASSRRYQVFVVNVDGTGITSLTPDQEGASTPLWSPEGSRIAYTLAGNVWTMNADGTGSAPLTSVSIGTEAKAVAWSPDGKQLLFDLVPRNGLITHTLYVASIGTGAQPTKLNTGNAQEYGDGWAPSSRIAFNNGTNAFTINGDGSGVLNVTQNVDPMIQIGGAVVVSKGSSVVFYRSRTDDSGRFDLWSVPAASGTATRVTNTDGTTSSDLATSVSADGSLVALRRSTTTIVGTTVVYTSQVGTVGTDGSNLHLFNAPAGTNANEVRFFNGTCQ
jgi:Tol biopolymer transport system component